MCSVAQFYPTLLGPWIISRRTPLSMGFPRLEYWSGLPFSIPEDLLDSGIEFAFLVSPELAGEFLGSPIFPLRYIWHYQLCRRLYLHYCALILFSCQCGYWRILNYVCDLHFHYITTLLSILPPRRKCEGQKHLLKYTLVYSLDCRNSASSTNEWFKGKKRTAIDQERWRASERESKEERKEEIEGKHTCKTEKEMATHSSVLAWRIPGTGEPGGLPSLGWCRVGHDWSDVAAVAYM